MNALVKPVDHALALVEVIDLKWLLAHEGHKVHVERLQTDQVYAEQCLDVADRSANATTRAVAASLRIQLVAAWTAAP